MKILVLIKKVPDTGIPLKVKEDGSDIVRDQTLTFVTNPYDEYALEEALRIREKVGEAEIIALSLGDEGAKDQLRNALALGADKAVLLIHPNYEWLDGLTTAKVIYEHVKNLNPDIILTGKMSVDTELSQVPYYLSELMGIPIASYIVKFELLDGRARVSRETDYGLDSWEVPLPAIFTCEKGLNEPRLATLKGIMTAKKKPIEEIQISEIGSLNVEKVKLVPPPEKAPGKIIDLPFPENVKELVRLLREEAKVL